MSRESSAVTEAFSPQGFNNLEGYDANNVTKGTPGQGLLGHLFHKTVEGWGSEKSFIIGENVGKTRWAEFLYSRSGPQERGIIEGATLRVNKALQGWSMGTGSAAQASCPTKRCLSIALSLVYTGVWGTPSRANEEHTQLPGSYSYQSCCTKEEKIKASNQSRN